MGRTVGDSNPPNSTASKWLMLLILFSIASNLFLSNYNTKSHNASSALRALTDLSFSLPPVANTSEARELKELNASHSLIQQLVHNLTTELHSLQGQFMEQTKEVQFLKSQHKLHHTKLKIHLWDDTCPEYGRREKQFFNVEGWSTHPRTMLVNRPEEADVVVWVSVRSNTEREVPPRNYSNVVLLDYADGCGPMHQKENELKHLIGYFRRSFVSRDQDSIYTGNCTDGRSDIYPLAYSGISTLVNKDLTKERKVLITNVLRSEGSHNTVRSRILDWTKVFVEKRNLQNVSVLSNVGWGSSGSDWDMDFQTHLENSKIIVTCNPWSWEGDFRLWEALLSGAMVMVDRMAIPNFMPHPFVHKKHLVYYDPRNQTEFEELLEYYVMNTEEAKKIGEAGYQFVLNHHMPKDRVEYILSKIQDKLVL